MNFKQRDYCEVCQSKNKTILLSKKFTDPLMWNFLEHYYKGKISKKDLYEGQYQIAKCNKCGFIWQTQVLTENLLDKLYSEWISSEDSLNKKKFANVSLFSKFAKESEAISFLLNKKPFEINVLDFGMGWGYWCLSAKSFGYNVKGFEISPVRKKFAKNNGIELIDDFSKLTDYKFDFINAEQVFEHICNPLQTLKDLANILTNKGIIRIAVPNGKPITMQLKRNGWQPRQNAIHPLEHINCFTYNTLLKLANHANLELLSKPLAPSLKNKIVFRLKNICRIHPYRQYAGTSLYLKKK